VLDEHGHPAPVGVPGELYIGGIGVARGYWGRPDLTAEKFVPDPYGRIAGARYYCTGDRARFLEDGNLEFLGRVDHQVKIRGYRIEPAEVESVLSGCPGVRKAMVVVREDVPGEKRLVGYVAVGDAIGDGVPGAGELRQYLKDRLPAYMVPTAWTIMAELPVGSSGKIDPKDLPLPDIEADAGQYVAPRTETEKTLAGIWEDILKVKQVGIHDNFFDLGGHSLLATQMISRIRSSFSAELPFRRLFEEPTVAELALVIDKLRADEGREKAPAIVRVGREQPLPLSFAQQRLWLQDQLQRDSAAYNVPVALRLQGDLRLDVMDRVFAELARRHEVLRTSFRSIDGEVRQIIAASGELRPGFVDLSSVAEEKREDEALRLAHEEAGKPFDLSQGPLLRAQWVRLAQQDHLLLVTMHHIITDGWSMQIIVREIARIYEACLKNEDPRLPEPAIQYADYAAWQQKWLRGEVLEKQLSYWEKQLADLPRVHGLPLDRPRPAVQAFHGAEHVVEVDRTTLVGLRKIAAKSRTTLFMTLHAAFALLLSRHAGSADVVIGAPVANRRYPELESLVGFFINTLVLRTDCSAGHTFWEYLAHVRNVNLEAQSNQDVPFEQVVERLNPDRSANHAPLYQIVFNFNTRHASEVRLPGLIARQMGGDRVLVKFDLIAEATEHPEGLSLSFTYNGDLFEASTIAGMAQHFRNLLRGVVAAPGEKIEELPLLTEAERHSLAGELNRTASDYPLERGVHELFEDQVARNPEGTAVVFEGSRLSYRELNERANRLAHYLRRLGAGPEMHVGLCLERGPEMIVALLGVLKAGAAYVPLDPSYPPERLEFMLRDAEIPVLLSSANLREGLPATGARVVCMDVAWPEISGFPDKTPETCADGDNLAYLIYTSGSTGRPKGVGVTHRGLSNYLQWAIRAYDVRPDTQSLLHSSLSFDLTVTSIYPALITGGCVVVLAQSAGTGEVAEYLKSGNQCLLKLTPSHLQMLQGLLEKDLLEKDLLEKNERTAGKLRALVIGGEMLKYGDLEFWQTVSPGTLLINEYGPTEAVVGCCVYEVGAGERSHGPVPIGTPIGNMRMYVLDEALRPVPIGIKGEIYIGGVGVTRGYWRRPGLTAERFVPDPFAETGGERLYRTGDLARYRNDRNIEYLGRVDQQIKLHGYRIEPGEIETVLASHPGVRQAVVVAHEDQQDDKRLIGYVVPASGDLPPSTDELKEHLRTRLPAYMVPAALVILDRIPLTPNGKLDSKALPKPEPPISEAEILAFDDIEMRLGLIWQEVLKVSPVDRRQTFFELGGHSWLALKLIKRVEEQFGQRLRLSAVFEAATIERMSDLLRRDAPGKKRSNLVPLQPRGSKRPVFFVHPGGGGVGAYRNLARLLGEDQPFYGLQALDDEENQMEEILSIEQRAARYIDAIQTVDPEGPYILGGWSLGGYISYEMAQQLTRQNREVACLLILDIAAQPPSQLLCSGDEADELLMAVKEKGVTQFSLDSVKNGSPEERLQYILNELIGAKILPAEVTLPVVRGFLKGLRRRDQSAINYRLSSYSGTVTLIRAEQGKGAEGTDIDPADPTLGFSRLCSKVEVAYTPGTHFNLVSPSYVETTAQVIHRFLREIEPRETETGTPAGFVTVGS